MSDSSGEAIRSYSDQNLNRNEILRLISLNATVRIFDRIGHPPRSGKTPSVLFDDYQRPSPVPEDLFVPTFGGSTYQWVIVGQPETGTGVHQDPVMTDAWNALLRGHKVEFN